ncbi:MAG TPA: hypothetical protein VFT43_14615 [Candidatus Polarisedimenticolia bacterium]|nr:hypothetical protein [Candidatus Polarisedimenticolia bacterium]
MPSRNGTLRRTTLLGMMVLSLGLAASCNSSGNTTIINQNLDCGLTRFDLLGNWRVDYTTSGTRGLTNCTGLVPSLTGSIDTTGISKTYSGVDVFGSDGSASFKVLGFESTPQNSQGDLTGSVQADSCLAFFRAWESDDGAYVQCIGTFDRTARQIIGQCDSAEVDTNADDTPDTSCSLSATYDVVVDLL